jgi:large subunit ribosomal protein L24
MNIKKGDKVKILKGKDKGKTGKVLQVFIEDNKLSIEGLNLLIKHLRPKKQGEKGQKIEFPARLNSANAILVCPKCDRPTRSNRKIIEVVDSVGRKKKKKVRVCKKCKAAID